MTYDADDNCFDEISDEVEDDVEIRRSGKDVIDDFKEFLKNYDCRQGIPKPEAKLDEYGFPIDNDPCEYAEHAFKALKFFFDNYDVSSESSHMRSESWNLDCHLVNDILFNVPILLKDRHGVPIEFCFEAHKQLTGNPDLDYETFYRESPSSSEEELKLAGKLFDVELEKLLLYAQLYTYYSEHGDVRSLKPESMWKEIDDKYKHTIPYCPGSNHHVKHEELQALIDDNWNKMWDQWKKIGRSCWD